MPSVELIMPKMGESIMEATILGWLKKEGDVIHADEPVLEIATDKVDSEVPSEVSGTLTKILFQEGEVVPVGKAVAIIEVEQSADVSSPPQNEPTNPQEKEAVQPPKPAPPVEKNEPIKISDKAIASGRFYSPLVLNIARTEGITMQELDTISGTGKDSRVTKKDILTYVDQKSSNGHVAIPTKQHQPEKTVAKTAPAPVYAHGENVEIIEMDRMRKLIAEHMVRSKATSAHVTSFVEADVTNIVLWRNKVKNEFLARENEKLTFTPIFMEAVAKALKDFPYVNASIQGEKIILKKDINIGMATALPSGNLIVPVIKKADQLNLVGLAKQVNDLANRARNNKLKPNEIEEGTYTLTNVGTFGNTMGTPIINQPQVGILAVGAIKKKPVVIETEHGDMIGIRHMMFLSHTYDHRIVDGALGGQFVRRVADYLENFDTNRAI